MDFDYQSWPLYQLLYGLRKSMAPRDGTKSDYTYGNQINRYKKLPDGFQSPEVDKLADMWNGQRYYQDIMPHIQNLSEMNEAINNGIYKHYQDKAPMNTVPSDFDPFSYDSVKMPPSWRGRT